MQYFVKQRDTLEGGIQFMSPAIEVSDMSLLVHNLIIYSLTGASAALDVTMQSSDDLEVWSDVGTSMVASAIGQQFFANRADIAPYGRYVRYMFLLTGTTPAVAYSFVLNTHAST